MPAYLFDTNLWLAAVFTSHPFHTVAQQALQQAKPGQPAIWCRATQQSFLRLLSTPAISKFYGADGLSNRDAWVALEALQALPQVEFRDEANGLYAIWRQSAALDSASPKVWMDAYLAAFAITGGLRLVTLDRDFRNFVVQGLDLELLSG